jgi:hypothetical protein
MSGSWHTSICEIPLVIGNCRRANKRTQCPTAQSHAHAKGAIYSRHLQHLGNVYFVTAIDDAMSEKAITRLLLWDTFPLLHMAHSRWSFLFMRSFPLINEGAHIAGRCFAFVHKRYVYFSFIVVAPLLQSTISNLVSRKELFLVVLLAPICSNSLSYHLQVIREYSCLACLFHVSDFTRYFCTQIYVRNLFPTRHPF